MSKLFLSKLALFALHDGICGSFYNKATIHASALHCVLWQNFEEDGFDMLYKNDCWAAIPDPIWTTNVPYERKINMLSLGLYYFGYFHLQTRSVFGYPLFNNQTYFSHKTSRLTWITQPMYLYLGHIMAMLYWYAYIPSLSLKM